VKKLTHPNCTTTGDSDGSPRPFTLT
jgi:hypothetical protein